MAILSKYDYDGLITIDRRRNRVYPRKFWVYECRCRSDRDGKCYDDLCRNVARSFECPRSCGRNCRNQMFRSSRNLPRVEVKRGLVGRGLFAKQDIKDGDFIIQYFGEVITHEMRETRQRSYERRDIPSYFFDVGRYIIDPTIHGNDAKYANHSCEPNMSARKWKIDNSPDGFYALGFVAERDIRKGEELFLHYSDSYSNGMVCKCGSFYCSGIVGKQLTREERKERDDALNQNIAPRRSRAQARRDVELRESAEAERVARARTSASVARLDRYNARSRSRARNDAYVGRETRSTTRERSRRRRD